MAESLWSLQSKSWIALVVFAQAFLLVLAVVTTCIFLFGRGLWKRHVERKIAEYNERIIESLFLGSEAKQSPLSLWFWQEHIYRDVLLNQIHLMAGPERERLVQHYVKTYFFDEDKKMLLSRAWWRRLSAVIRLDILSAGNCKDSFLESMNDNNPLVALSARRALSRLGAEADPQLILHSLEKLGRERRDAMVEIISNIGTNFGAGEICKFLRTCNEPEVAIACVRVLGDLRSVEAMPILLEHLRAGDTLNEELLCESIEAARLISDPEAIDPIRKHLSHRSSFVRAKAVQFLIDLMDDEATETLALLKQSDSSIEVQRALQRFVASKRSA